jgi:adenylate cyclase
MSPKPRKLAAGLSIGLGAAAVVLLLGRADLLVGTAELKTYDWRVRSAADARAVHPDIVLVEINDASIQVVAEHAGRWPWPRVVLSSVIDFLNRSQARVVAVDLTITEPDTREGFPYGGDRWSGAESDAALVESVRNARGVVMLADAVFRGFAGGRAPEPAVGWSTPYELGPAIAERPLITPPIPGLTRAATALGHNFLSLDPDGPARRMAPFIRVGDQYVPSLGVAAALVGGGFRPEEVTLDGTTLRVRDRAIPLVPVRVEDAPGRTHDQLTMLVNYRAPVLVDGVRPYKSYEVRDLLVSEEQAAAGMAPLLDPALFKDKIVFVGLTASGLLDVFNTPFGEGTMPGIQLHASMADSILSNRFIAPASNAARLWATIGLALLVGLMSALLPVPAAAAGALLVMGGWTWYALAAFRDGLWVNMAQPLSGAALALFGGTAYQYFVEGAEKRVVKRLFGRYVSRDVYEQLVNHPELAELGGRRRDMTVLFSDIRGFTSITEKGEPEALVGQLNEYFTRMVAIVFRHHGTVDKFVGDMVMALFGAPVEDGQHAEHAVQAAVDMVGELGELNRKWASEGRAQLDIGVGINSGEMIAGNIGSASIMSYTVIGDNVNLGSRLESLNKDYRTRIIISDATRARLTGQYDIRPLGDVIVKGKTRPVAIFEVVVPAPLPAPTVEAKL